MTLASLILPTLLACSSGKLPGGECDEGQTLDDDGNCVDDGGTGDGGAGDGGTGDGGTSDGGTGDGGTTDGGTGDGGTTDGGTEDCGVDLDGSEPEDGDDEVDLGTKVLFTLDDGDPSATVTVASLDGSSVAGSYWLAEDDTEVWFQPEGPLSGNTTYVATLDWCGGTESVSFTTLDPGEPVEDIEANSYLMDLAGATWTKPEGAGSLLSGTLDLELMLAVASTSASSIEMYGAIGDGAGNQDTCNQTIDFPSADFTENPFFQLGPSDVAFDVSGYSASLSNFRLAGSFNEDATRIEDGTVDAELDVRELASVLGDLLGTEDPDTLCSYMVLLGVSCGSCTGDGEPYCVAVRIEDVEGELMDESVDVVEQENCHPECAESWSNPDCDTSSF